MKYLCLLCLLVASAFADEPKRVPDYQNPPKGSWGVSWCGNKGVIWVQDASGYWWSFSSEDGTAPPLDNPKAIEFFNDWLQSGPTDVRKLNVPCP